MELLCKVADDNQRREAFRQVHIVWPHAPDPEEHLRRRLASAQHQRATWLVGTSGQDVVTSLGAYPFTLRTPAGLTPARVFGAVFTPAEQRGHGYASTLLTWAMDHYAQQGVRDFFLYSDIAPQFYERLGFGVLPSFAWTLPAVMHPTYTLEQVKFEPPPLADAHWLHGFARSDEDRGWLWKKSGPNVVTHLYRAATRARSPLYLMSSLQDQNYLLLDSNVSQEPEAWAEFAALVQHDAAQRGASSASGWWVSKLAAPPASMPAVLARPSEILMHCRYPSAGALGHSPFAGCGFRASLCEHV